jgi:hypothetical protein
LLTNIRLGWKGLKVTNSLAHYGTVIRGAFPSGTNMRI